MSAELRVESLVKRFAAGRNVVDDVSFHIAPGEIVSLLGPSGCGKTTTLRIVAGLEHPSGGRVLIGGDVAAEPQRHIFVPPQRRGVGMVFQSYAVWPHMTVFDNVAYPLRHRKVRGAALTRQVTEVLSLVGLHDYADRSVAALSGGQMQRVALARSLAYQPRLLLLDEPLSNLDVKLRIRLRDELRRIIKSSGVTGLYVTHDQSEAIVLADRIGVMLDGRLVQIADPQTLFNAPATAFVAEFTGATGPLRGRVVRRAGREALVQMPSGQVLLGRAQTALDSGDAADIYLRPESVRRGLGTDQASTPNLFPARVLSAQFQGGSHAYQLELLSGVIEMVELGSGQPVRSDEVIEIVLPPESCWLFASSPAASDGGAAGGPRPQGSLGDRA